ncbi:MAG: IS110 family transposase [Melioribacteraceae bacterium]
MKTQIMKTQNSNLDFSNQDFYLGIDVHKNSWNVSIRSNNIKLKTFSMNPKPIELVNYMNKHYPNGNYFSVYEAGFCGFSAHRFLSDNGINNIIVSPTNLPSSSKERLSKTDKVDSGKLARFLESKSIKGIYIPSFFQQELRSLSRLRFQLIKKQTRIKNQIKCYLYFYGHSLPDNSLLLNWSRSFIEHLRNIQFQYDMGKHQLDIYIDELLSIRNRLLQIMKFLRFYSNKYGLHDNIKLLSSIPGIGFTTAITIITEIMDINRFPNFDQFNSFVGFVPSTDSTGDNDKVLGTTFLFNKFLRSLIIEAAWIAIRKDPALTLAFNGFLKRMSKQKAIIRIAKKLSSRIYFVLKNNTLYSCGMVN